MGEKILKAVIRYPGSKWGIADWIISFFPEGYEHMVYMEGFSGSAAVFFNKKPGAVETINDMDGDIVNLFCVLRDRPEDLKRVLSLTPYSREEYDMSFAACEDPLERARRYMVRTTQAIGAKMDGKCGWRNHKQMKIGGTACRWAGIWRRLTRLLLGSEDPPQIWCKLNIWTRCGLSSAITTRTCSCT